MKNIYKEGEETYKVLLSRDEAILIQRLRDIKFGTLKVWLTNGSLVRTETSTSELIKDTNGEKIIIAHDTVIEQ